MDDNNYDGRMTQQWISNNEAETKKIAANIARDMDYPCIICLYGDLGAGKTAFSRAFIRKVLNDSNLIIPSPTYTIVQTYDDDAIWHFDLYRLDDPDQLYDIGWEDAVVSKLCLIEWPDRLGRLKPKKTVDITIDVLQGDARRITISA